MRTRTAIFLVALVLGVIAWVRDVGPWLRGQIGRRQYAKLTCREWVALPPIRRAEIVETMLPELQAAEAKTLGVSAPVGEGEAAGFADTVALGCDSGSVGDRAAVDLARDLWIARSRSNKAAPNRWKKR